VKDRYLEPKQKNKDSRSYYIDSHVIAQRLRDSNNRYQKLKI